MGRFYTANSELKDFLLEQGMTFHDREEEEFSYYTDHFSGKQVKINNNTKLVSFLDAKGLVLDTSSCYTDNQIKKFLEN